MDQHLFEPRTAWRDHIDPPFGDDALAIDDDPLGWPWLTWRGRQLYPVESQRPMHPEEVGLLNLDGASDFYTARHGSPVKELRLRPSEYLLQNVRVAALAYEAPAYLVKKVGDEVLMFGSDWPHAEGVAHPRADYEAALTGLDDAARAKVMGGNAAWLLRL